jgi:hypothetical protein
MAFSVINLMRSLQNLIISTIYLYRIHSAPVYYSTSPLPLCATLEPGITGHEFLKEWMELIFGPQSELQSVHKSNEALSRPQ